MAHGSTRERSPAAGEWTGVTNFQRLGEESSLRAKDNSPQMLSSMCGRKGLWSNKTTKYEEWTSVLTRS